MTLRHAVQNLDLCSAINRLCLHNDPVELALLTEAQFATYLESFANNDETCRAICEAINRPDPRSSRAQQPA